MRFVFSVVSKNYEALPASPALSEEELQSFIKGQK